MKSIWEIKDNITSEIKNEIDMIQKAQKMMTIMMVTICFMPLLIILAFILGKKVGKSSERRKAKRREKRKVLFEKGMSKLKGKEVSEDGLEQDDSEEDDEFDFEENDFMFVD